MFGQKFIQVTRIALDAKGVKVAAPLTTSMKGMKEIIEGFSSEGPQGKTRARTAVHSSPTSIAQEKSILMATAADKLRSLSGHSLSMTFRRIFSKGQCLAGMLILLLGFTAVRAWPEQADATSSASRTTGNVAVSADATSSASRASKAPGDLPAKLCDVLQGPALRLSLLVALVGILYRIRQFRRLTRVQHTLPSPAESVGAHPFRGRFLRAGVISHPVMRTTSLAFHMLLVLVPLLLPAHNMILHRSLHASLPTIPSPLADWLTMSLIVIGGFFLVRRLAFPRVRALSTVYDYAILLLVLAPFITGLMAYHHVTSSQWLMVAHVASADVLFLAIPFTKLGHMPFMIFSRFFVSGEYTWRAARRAWGRGS
jgi:nitrate reductase gamma subunit